MLNNTNHQGNAYQNHNETSSQLSEWLSPKRREIRNVGEDVEKREHLHTHGGYLN